MQKAFIHAAVLGVVFFGMWRVLSLVDFVEMFEIEQFTRENEQKLGEFVLETLSRGNDEVESDTVRTYVDLLKDRLCSSNGIPDTSIRIHILVRDDINAFALPDRHLVVYTGLIRYCSSPDELSGVLAHEIAHMEHNHVMKKLVKEVGLAMLLAMAGGESSGEIGRQVVKLLSSSAFDREQESEADRSAVHMMATADIDPEHLASFLFRLSQEKLIMPRNLEWLSTHPNAQDRSAEILRLRKQESYHQEAVRDRASWDRVLKILEE
jgi:predicted Zn-dependent protease